MNTVLSHIVVAALALLATPVMAVDESAATDLIKDSRCTKCHAVAVERLAPPFRDIAAKYKGKPEAIAVLTKHVTVPSEVEMCACGPQVCNARGAPMSRAMRSASAGPA